MAKDLVIGGASGYNWNQLRYWVNSIKKTGFEGDVVLVVTNMSGDTVQKLVDNDVKVYAYGKRSEDGSIAANDSKIPPHVERFIFIWNYLREHEDEYRFVTVTDTRDVIFQKDPTEFLEKKLFKGSIVCSSEGLIYKDEPWGNKNLLDTFGPLIHNELKDKMIYNVGTIAGFSAEVRDLLIQIFFQSVNRPIPVVDQAVFNFLINLHPLSDEVMKLNNDSGWAIQLGTTIDAIKAGAGDIGREVNGDFYKLDMYTRLYRDTQPFLTEDGLVINGSTPFTIVHQWDRVPAIKNAVEKLYGDGKCEDILTIKTN